MFDLILYIPSTIFQLNRDGTPWVEPVLSYDKCVLLKDHNPVMPVKLKPTTPQSRVKHSTTALPMSLRDVIHILPKVLGKLNSNKNFTALMPHITVVFPNLTSVDPSAVVTQPEKYKWEEKVSQLSRMAGMMIFQARYSAVPL